MTPPAPSIQETLNELHDLCAFFINAEKTIQNGSEVDMTGMDERIGTVCKTVQNALPDHQKEYLPELSTLLNLLNSCEMAIQSIGPTPAEPMTKE